MQKIFSDTRVLDKYAREKFSLTEDIMIENAASELERALIPHEKNPSGFYINRAAVLILTGPGNNGADGFALARRLAGHELAVTVCEVCEASSAMCVLEKQRALLAGIQIISAYDLDDYIEEKSVDLRVVVDCIFGSGFHGSLPAEAAAVITEVNKNTDAYRIACDIPSGLDMYGNSTSVVFSADETVTMGALKLSLFSDTAKDFCGKITLASVGITRQNYEQELVLPSCAILLDTGDAHFPFRQKQNVHKGNFGHAAVVCGEKSGAAMLCAKAASVFGAGLVTVVNGGLRTPYSFMDQDTIPPKANVVALGMGLGHANSCTDEYIEFLLRHEQIACVLDADILYSPRVNEILKSRPHGVVLTPHPKELCALLNNSGFEVTFEETVAKRFELTRAFCCKFPGAVLVAKGACVYIARKTDEKKECTVYVNPHGTQALAKGGSGDLLTGLTAGLLAQKYDPAEAACTASLALALASQKAPSTYSLTPEKILDIAGRFESANFDAKV